MRKKLILVAVVIALLLSSFFSGTYCGRRWEKDSIRTETDTVYRTDTILKTIPEPYAVIMPEYVYIPVAEKDTVRIHDTLMLQAQKERKTYRTTEYTAIISGVFANLDFIETYNITRTITNTVVREKSGWGFSIGAGPGIIYTPFHKGLDAGVGVWGGVSYTF